MDGCAEINSGEVRAVFEIAEKRADQMGDMAIERERR
jgi:hypothetical protein